MSKREKNMIRNNAIIVAIGILVGLVYNLTIGVNGMVFEVGISVGISLVVTMFYSMYELAVAMEDLVNEHGKALRDRNRAYRKASDSLIRAEYRDVLDNE